jgi:hypothetical protein
MKGQSIHAHIALKELHNVDWLNGVIRGCIWDESLGPPETHPNIRLFDEVERYLSFRQIAHAGDTFNTYCQNILAAILEADPSHWPKIKDLLRAKSAADAITALRKQKENDHKVRTALRERLAVSWCNELEIICTLRNKIVHQAAIDHEREVAQTVAKFPPGQHKFPPPDLEPGFPVEVSPDGTLLVDAKTAHWATWYVAYHIHLLDQTICHQFRVPREPRPLPSLSFHFSGGKSYRALFPGTPLPKPPPIPRPRPAPALPPLPPIPPMSDAKEIACAKKWNALRNELDAAVRAICDQNRVEIDGIFGQLVGIPASRTIAHHELHLGYDMHPAGSPKSEQNRLGIRIRQKDFVPFVTVWSDRTMMRDFESVDDLTEVTEEITTAIHATVS